jgi:drug/metabolite transporter (DMT)-like permease
MKNQTTLIALAAICWGIMPVLIRKSGLPTGLVGTVFAVLSGLLIVMYVGTSTQHQVEFKQALSAGNVTVFTVSLIVIGAILSGIGSIAYYELFSKINGFKIAEFLPRTSSLVPLITFIGSFLFLKEPITRNQIIGMGLIICGIFTINK